MRASLPAYVKWSGKVSPANEDISYNNSGQIIWKIGNVDTYTSSNSRRKQVSFQIIFEPSVADVGTSPALVNESVLTAQDEFTGRSLQESNGVLTTRFSMDSSFRAGDDIVVGIIKTN